MGDGHTSSPSRMTGLFGKEMQALAPFTPLLVVIQVLVWVGLTRTSASPDTAALFRTGALVFAAALYGALFFGLEPPAVRGFLLQLPLGRDRLLAGKTLAAALHMTIFWTLSDGLSTLLSVTQEDADRRGRLLLVLLAYPLCALLSTFSREAVTALVGGSLALIVGTLLSNVLTRGSQEAGAVLGIVAAVAAWWGLRCRMTTLEDRPEGSAGTHVFVSAGRLRPRLWAVEWRQKRSLVLLLLALPALSAALDWHGPGPFVAFLWAPIAGAVLGVVVFTEPERDGADFFLHHLPISRRVLVAQRLVFGLAFGVCLFVEFLGMMWLHLRQTQERYPLAGEGLAAFVFQFGFLFLVAFGLGKMLSPWVSSSLVGVVLAVLTLLTLAVVPGLFSQDEIVWRRHGSLLVAVFGLAWWSTVHSRGLEPGSGKTLRALWLLAPFWALAMAFLVRG